MAIQRRRWTSLSLATLSLLAIVVSTACGRLSLPIMQSGGDAGAVGGAAQPAGVADQAVANATPTPRVRPGGLRPVAVKLDSLTETLSLDGVVAAQAQEPVLYQWRGIVDDVKVKTGQSVKQGDILVEFAQGDLPRNVETARAHLQQSQDNLAAAQAQADAAQAAAAQRTVIDQKKQQQIILDAETALARAQDNLRVVRAGKSQTDRQVAQTAVTYYGDTNLALAQHALDAALAGPDEATIRAAERDVANLQIALKKAQTDLDTLKNGPDPEAMRTAQAALQRAETQLQLAQTAKIDPKAPDRAVAKIQHDQAIVDAQTGVDNAQAQATKLKQPPADVDVQAANYRVLDAQTNLSTAQAKLDALQAGPDQATVDAAQQKLEYAKHTLAELQIGLNDVLNHPTPAELHAAEDLVQSAQTALDNARQGIPNDAAAGPDLAPLQKAIAQDQAEVAQSEQALENTHLRAPFDGTVVSIKNKPGDATVPSRPVVIMARPGLPIVHLDLEDAQADRLTAGMPASVQIGTGAAASRAEAKVNKVTLAGEDGAVAAFANLNVSWAGDQSPKIGTQVQATVNLGAKQDVLVVPKSAVHKTGARTTVEVQDGANRRIVTVQVGITNGDSAEIVSGLSAGQIVLAGPSV